MIKTVSPFVPSVNFYRTHQEITPERYAYIKTVFIIMCNRTIP